VTIELPSVARFDDSADDHSVSRLLGESTALRAARRLISTVSRFDVSVLLTGESGTGKELAARAIHDGSVRSGMPFVAMNCGAIPDGLVESELFGHSKGAFTGATAARDGAFTLAHGGTILLDEIGDFRLDLQVKLLRVLQEKKVIPLGESTGRPVDVRVLAASNRELSEEVGEGRFRGDLYYRLAVFPIHLPPLRDRDGDVLRLSDYFLRSFARKHKKHVIGFSVGARLALESWHWPGNVRELRNVVERAVILVSGADEVGVHCLPVEIQTGDDSVRPPDHRSVMEHPDIPVATDSEAATDGEEILPLVEEERRIIMRALTRCSWDVPHVAKRLGMSRATLYRRIRKLGLVRPGSAASGETSV